MDRFLSAPLCALLALFLGAGAFSCGSDRFSARSNRAPEAVIAGGDQAVQTGLSVLLDGSASQDPDGDIRTYTWNFGDNTAAIDGAPTVEYIYQNAGTYTVQLTVTDDQGAMDTDRVLVTVGAGSGNTPPVVQIWGVGESILPPASIASGTSVRFTGVATDIDGSPKSYTWNFGDGTLEEGGLFAGPAANPMNSGSGDPAANVNAGSASPASTQVDHLFTNPTGSLLTFEVTLAVEDDQGAVATATRWIEVSPEAPAPAPTGGYDGMWSWSLKAGEPVDPSGLGLCSFQDSMLQIDVDPSSSAMTVQEMLNGVSQVTYSGDLNGTNFNVSTPLGSQSIEGTFDSPTTFVGTYTISVMGMYPACETPREVWGVKQ